VKAALNGLQVLLLEDEPLLSQMIPFVCALAPHSPAPHPHEHVALAWARLDDLTRYDLAAADYPVIEAYRATR